MKIRILFSMLFFSLGLFITSLNAQYTLVDFMYVPEGGEDTYIQMEKSYAKPVHQELIDQDKLTYWGLFRVAYPAGTGAEYHYVTVRQYTKEQLKHSTEFNAAFEKVHAEEILEAIFATVINTRDLVKTYQFIQWERFIDPNLTEHPNILQVVYFKNDWAKWDDYQEMETKLFHPMHKKEIEMGYRAGWEGYQLTQPMGTSMPYTHVAVDTYKDWDQYMSDKNSNAVLKAAHPNKSADEIDAVFLKTANLVKMEEWHLIDYVAKEN